MNVMNWITYDLENRESKSLGGDVAEPDASFLSFTCEKFGPDLPPAVIVGLILVSVEEEEADKWGLL